MFLGMVGENLIPVIDACFHLCSTPRKLCEILTYLYRLLREIRMKQMTAFNICFSFLQSLCRGTVGFNVCLILHVYNLDYISQFSPC